MDLEIDPKLAWALRNPQFFPIDINTAEYSWIIRIPGIGRQSANKIVQARKYGKLKEFQLRKMGIAYNRAKYFMVCQDTLVAAGFHYPEDIRKSILERNPRPQITTSNSQLTLF